MSLIVASSYAISIAANFVYLQILMVHSAVETLRVPACCGACLATYSKRMPRSRVRFCNHMADKLGAIVKANRVWLVHAIQLPYPMCTEHAASEGKHQSPCKTLAGIHRQARKTLGTCARSLFIRRKIRRPHFARMLQNHQLALFDPHPNTRQLKDRVKNNALASPRLHRNSCWKSRARSEGGRIFHERRTYPLNCSQGLECLQYWNQIHSTWVDAVFRLAHTDPRLSPYPFTRHLYCQPYSRKAVLHYPRQQSKLLNIARDWPSRGVSRQDTVTLPGSSVSVLLVSR